jgi:outer membrane protein
LKIAIKAILLLCIISNNICAQDLLGIYELGLQNDPELRQAHANLQAVRETKSQSIAQMLPNVSLSASKSHDRFTSQKTTFRSVVSSDQEFWSQRFSLNLVQPIFHWDHWVQLGQSENQIAEADASYLAQQQDLMVRITEAYFNVLSAQDNLQFTVKEKTAIARQLDQAQQRFQVGLIAITDVHEAQAGFDQAGASEILASNELDNSKEALREIIGDSEVNLDKLGKNLPLIKPNPDEINVWSNSAEQQNLSIVAAFNSAEFARKAVEIQRGGHYPKLDFVASYEEADVDSSSGFDGRSHSLGLQLDMPLFAGGAVLSRTRQAQHQYRQAKQQLIAVQRSVKRQVRDAFRGVISNISRVRALKTAVISTQSALEASEAGYEVGTRTLVDVLDEQSNLYRARRDLSRSRYDYLINSIKLKRAASRLNRDDLEQINHLLL